MCNKGHAATIRKRHTGEAVGSDSAPADGWLANMLQAKVVGNFRNSCAGVHLEHSTLVSGSSETHLGALCWKHVVSINWTSHKRL